ncbi:hypothetical protein E2C01_018835 [Portunus trituberculatus]|uniref:Uncharacterized protein n=1 Tax=Portunus trituberculatus TaxID=210409 RepID=A0A5B7DXN0_PORTR|nr:hypothetical protein [Portunus trituberculatus]
MWFRGDHVRKTTRLLILPDLSPQIHTIVPDNELNCLKPIGFLLPRTLCLSLSLLLFIILHDLMDFTSTSKGTKRTVVKF